MRADGYYILGDAITGALSVARWITTDWPDTGDGEWLICGSEVSRYDEELTATVRAGPLDLAELISNA